MATGSEKLRAWEADSHLSLQESDTERNAGPAPAAFPSDPSSVLPGTHLDHYIIEGVAIRTGTTSILRGKDLRTGCEVAIKIPHLEVESDVIFFSRFQREREVGQKLNHPGIAKVFAD